MKGIALPKPLFRSADTIGVAVPVATGLVGIAVAVPFKIYIKE